MELLDKKERILAAAIHLFREFGVRHSTMEQIAREAKVGKGTLYLYFEDKTQLFAAVMERKWQEMSEAISDTLRRESGILDQLMAMLRSVTDFRARDPFMQKIQLEHVHYRTPEIEIGLGRIQLKAIEWVERLLREGMLAGDIPQVDPRMLAFLLVKAQAAFVYEWPSEYEPVEPEQLASLLRLLVAPKNK